MPTSPEIPDIEFQISVARKIATFVNWIRKISRNFVNCSCKKFRILSIAHGKKIAKFVNWKRKNRAFHPFIAGENENSVNVYQGKIANFVNRSTETKDANISGYSRVTNFANWSKEKIANFVNQMWKRIPNFVNCSRKKIAIFINRSWKKLQILSIGRGKIATLVKVYQKKITNFVNRSAKTLDANISGNSGIANSMLEEPWTNAISLHITNNIAQKTLSTCIILFSFSKSV